jgi:hypothetical protein
MADKNVVNPGLVNVADEADGVLSVDQAVTSSPSYNPGPTVSVVTEAPLGRGLTLNVQPS